MPPTVSKKKQKIRNALTYTMYAFKKWSKTHTHSPHTYGNSSITFGYGTLGSLLLFYDSKRWVCADWHHWFTIHNEAKQPNFWKWWWCCFCCCCCGCCLYLSFFIHVKYIHTMELYMNEIWKISASERDLVECVYVNSSSYTAKWVRIVRNIKTRFQTHIDVFIVCMCVCTVYTVQLYIAIWTRIETRAPQLENRGRFSSAQQKSGAQWMLKNHMRVSWLNF